MNINGEIITCLRFADVLVAMAETVEDFSAMLDDLSRAWITLIDNHGLSLAYDLRA